MVSVLCFDWVVIMTNSLKKQDHLCFGQVQGHKIHNNRIYSNNNNWGQSGQSEGSHFTILSINSIYFSWYRSFTYPPGRVPLITFCLRCIFTQKWSFSYSWLFSVQSSTALSTTTLIPTAQLTSKHTSYPFIFWMIWSPTIIFSIINILEFYLYIFSRSMHTLWNFQTFDK